MGVGGQEVQEKATAMFACAKMNFSPDILCKFIQADPIYEALLRFYCVGEDKGGGETYVPNTPWNEVRKRIILRALRDELYPMFWLEVQKNLANAAEAEVCRRCREELLKIVDVQPYKITPADIQAAKDERSLHNQDADADDPMAGAESDDDNDMDWKLQKKYRLNGYCSVLVVAPETSKENCIVALVSPFGDPIDMRQLYKTFPKEPKEGQILKSSLDQLKEKKRMEHRDTFKTMLQRHTPAIILVMLTDMDARRMKEDLEKLIESPDIRGAFKVKPAILYGNPSIPRIVGYNDRLKEQGVYADCELPQQRIAISAARFAQDPLSETCQLWHDLLE
jgi:hypothetical protein